MNVYINHTFGFDIVFYGIQTSLVCLMNSDTFLLFCQSGEIAVEAPENPQAKLFCSCSYRGEAVGSKAPGSSL